MKGLIEVDVIYKEQKASLSLIVTLGKGPSLLYRLRTPKFCKARPVPYVLKSKIETELSRLEKQGVIKPIEFSQWAVPIVLIVKDDGTI